MNWAEVAFYGVIVAVVVLVARVRSGSWREVIRRWRGPHPRDRVVIGETAGKLVPRWSPMRKKVTSREEFIPLPLECGAYRPGHDMHWIQAKLSWEKPPIGDRTVRDVADDGTITFTDGTTRWHHDPERLRTTLKHFGSSVELREHGVLAVPVLAVPSDDGYYFFCVGKEPDPCREETAEDIPGESLDDETARRGGFSRPAAEVLAEWGRLGEP